MIKPIRKLFYIQISELIVVVLLAGIGIAVSAVSGDVQIGVTVPEPADPVISTVVTYPDIDSIMLTGSSMYADHLLWLDDHGAARTTQFITDTNGNFILPLDADSPFTQPGEHMVEVVMELDQEPVVTLVSNPIKYYVDDQRAVFMQSEDQSNISFTSATITPAEFARYADRYRAHSFELYSAARYKVSSSYRALVIRYTIVRWSIVVFAAAMIIILIFRRWFRKTAEQKSFWSLGPGIYIRSPRE